MTLFDDFTSVGPMPENIVEKYSKDIPASLLEVWKKFGLGSFCQGYFRIINPDEYLDLLSETYVAHKPALPVMTTGMGDIIVWQDGYFMLLDYRYGLISVLGSERLFFHLLKSEEEGFLIEDLHWLPYPEACSTLGAPSYDACFAYVPILGAGGPESVDNLERADLKTHIQIITAFMGPLDTYKVHP